MRNRCPRPRLWLDRARDPEPAGATPENLPGDAGRMSHFLARLVDRAHGTAPCVEPLVAPRFAPGPTFEGASEVEALPPGREQQPTIAKQTLSAEKPGAKRVWEPEKLPVLPEKAAADLKPEKLLVPMAEHSTMLVKPARAANRAEPLGKNGKALVAASTERPR